MASVWQDIRILRTHPPALITGERAPVFVAALEQSEQLMKAASDVGPAARPLLLFYALSQAGRAVAAARVQDDAWRLAGHGLTEPFDQPNGGDLLRRVITPQKVGAKRVVTGRRSSFAGVADAVGSGQLTGNVELGAVWAALPHLMPPEPQPETLDAAWSRPLAVYPSPDDDGAPETQVLLDGRALELLVDLPQSQLELAARSTDEAIDELRGVYPATDGMYAPRRPGEVRTLTCHWGPVGRMLPLFGWPALRHPVKLDDLETIAPAVRGPDERVLLPRVAGRDLLSPLMLWWVLLFGLSMVARYDPEVWVATLDVNESSLAVPLEAALDLATDVLPEMILDELAPRRVSH
jgi:hypothetical protein